MDHRESFDTQLFTWDNWNQEGPLQMQFSEVVLKVPVGEYAIGTKFPFAYLLGDASLLVLIDDQEKEHAFDLKVSVGASVELPESDACDLPQAEACGINCTHNH